MKLQNLMKVCQLIIKNLKKRKNRRKKKINKPKINQLKTSKMKTNQPKKILTKKIKNPMKMISNNIFNKKNKKSKKKKEALFLNQIQAMIQM